MKQKIPFSEEMIKQKLLQRNLVQNEQFNHIFETYNQVSESLKCEIHKVELLTYQNFALQNNNIDPIVQRQAQQQNQLIQKNLDLAQKEILSLQNQISLINQQFKALSIKYKKLRHEKIQVVNQLESQKQYQYLDQNAKKALENKIKQYKEENKQLIEQNEQYLVELKKKDIRNIFLEQSLQKTYSQKQIAQRNESKMLFKLLEMQSQLDDEMLGGKRSKNNKNNKKMVEMEKISYSKSEQRFCKSCFQSKTYKKPKQKRHSESHYKVNSIRKAFTQNIQSNKNISNVKISLHQCGVTAMKQSANGDFLITAGLDGVVQFYDPHENHANAIITMQKPKLNYITSIDISFFNNLLLLAKQGQSNCVELYQIDPIQQKCKQKCFQIQGHKGQISDARFLDLQNSKCITGSLDRCLKYWDLNKGQIIKTKFCQSSCLCMDLTNSTLYTGHQDRSVKIWSVQSQNQDMIIKNLTNTAIQNVCLSKQNDQQLLISSKDSEVKLIDLRKNGVVQTYQHHLYRDVSGGNSIAFSRDNQNIIAASRDGQIIFWDIHSGKVNKIFENGHQKPLTALSYNVLSTYMYSADEEGYICYWN